MVSDFLSGVKAFRQGIKLSFQKPILPYLVFPNLINALLFAVGGYFLFQYVGVWAGEASGSLPTWLPAWLSSTVEVLIYVLSILLFLMLMATSFSLITGLLIAPFLAILAEQIERSLRPTDYPSLKLSQILGRSFKREILRLRYIVLRLVLLLLVAAMLSLLPGLNIFVPVIWFFYNAWMKSIEFCDFAADNNGHDLPATLNKLKRNRMQALGFGSVAYLATMIPIVNLFALPVAVSGATFLWVNKIEGEEKSV